MSSKNIYVAGASSEIDRVEGLMYELRVKGWRITYDWAQTFRRVRLGLMGNTETDHMNYAVTDLKEGIEKANVVWIVMPDNNKASIGCWVELGYALAYHQKFVHPHELVQRIIVSGHREQSNIFALLAHKIYNTHEEALKVIVGS